MSTADWVVVPRSRPRARARLLCFPHAGGRATAYAPWAELAGPDVELAAVELPGHGTRLRQPPIADPRALVRATTAALFPHLDRPFALFGHSFGALLAYEVARALRRVGGPAPVHLFVSGQCAPHLAALAAPPPARTDDELLAELRRLGGTPATVLGDAALLSVFLPALAADFAFTDRYAWIPGPPLGCALTAFVGDDDAEAGDVAPWGEHTTGDFSVRRFPGGHFFLHSAADALVRHVCDATVAALATVASP